MNAPRKPLEIIVYQDVLCAWCYVAEQRFVVLQRELGAAVRWKYRPYPLRLREDVPTRKLLDEWIVEVKHARGEPEGAALSPALWESEDPPRSSLKPLMALEAARLQGGHWRERFANVLRRSALELGVNVTRTDVLFELADRVGLNMGRFAAAFQSPQTQRLIVEEHRLAESRGVKRVPTLVLGGRWMVCGLRDVAEYRAFVLECMGRRGSPGIGSPDSVVH
jgi:predicted DsbA family dithiol-disulfide isomerase